jgi:DNA-binding CsgD family transcriptional regulator
VLVGRDAEALLLAGVLARLRGGSGSVAVFAGEAGIGKTRMAGHAASLAHQAGVFVATGRAVAGLSVSPLRPVAEALMEAAHGRPRPAGHDLAPYVAVLAVLVPAWRDADWRHPAESPLVVAESVLRVLGELAAGGGMLLVVEDLHWADDATIEVVRYLADHVSEVAVALVVTVRTGEGRDGLIPLLAGGGARICQLGRLPGDQAAAMARACAGISAEKDARGGDGAVFGNGPGAVSGGGPGGELAVRIARASEGLPLLVEDLLAAGDPAAVPRRFADTVRDRLDRLGADERMVLAAAAVLGRRFDWRVVAAMTALDGQAVAGALRTAARVHLVVPDDTGFAFRHALTREVVLGDLDGVERQRLSLTAAEKLAEGPSLAGSAADHDLQVARLFTAGGAPSRAAAVLHGAGRRALEAGAFAEAEAVLRAAVAGSEAAGLPGLGVGTHLVRTLVLSGQPTAALEFARHVGALGRDTEREAGAELVRLQARAALALGRWADARDYLDQARQATGDLHRANHPAVRAEILLLDADLALGDSRPGSRAGAGHLAAQGVSLAREAGRADLECDALETVGRCARLRDLDDAARALSRALALAVTAGLGAHRLRLLAELGTVEMLRDARGDRLEQAREQALRSGAIGTSARIAVDLAAGQVMTGQFAEAMRTAAGAGTVAGRLGLVPLVAASHLLRGFAAAHQGDRAAMDQYLAAAEKLAPEDPDLRAGAWGIGRGLLALIEEDRAAARRAFARARAAAPDQHARILNPFQGPELLLRVLAGEASMAEVQADAAALVRAARWPALWNHAALAVARGAVGDRTGAASALEEALDAARRYPVFRALVRRLAGEAALRDGWGEPVPLLRAAEAGFGELRLGRAAAACRGLLRTAGEPAPRRRRGDAEVGRDLLRAGVTPREAEVLGLVADRLANREIAARLYVSPRTVEKHVAALLSKLGAADRAGLVQLARALAKAPGQDGGGLPMR